MSNKPASRTTLAIFCKVVDNYGDIGICWRLARQLELEHDVEVTLWVDDLASFQRICPQVRVDAETQQQAGVTVRHWRDQEAVFAPEEVAHIVIEFFGCDIPPGYIAAMVQCTPRPVWFNLEGLTAEEWVEGCHTLSSPHPRLSLTKHFFFPGFTAKTGGLLREAALDEERLQFQAQPAEAAGFMSRLGLTPAEQAAFKVSLFCYPHAPVAELLAAWQEAGRSIACLVPHGVAAEAVEAFLGEPAVPGAVRTRGDLTVRVLPFVAQPDYDRLLWSCQLNVVRGEDSFVRAQWAGRPFIWHIYPQDENLHHVKLRAFLKRYAGGLDSLSEISLHWNGAATALPAWRTLWSAFQSQLPEMTQRSVNWQREMLRNGELAGNLMKFARALG
jgi:uncharacterized repeat protein (TIGR03837 family)